MPPHSVLFPLLFFLGFAVLAAILQIYHQWAMQREKKRPVQSRQVLLMGRKSNLNLFKDVRQAPEKLDASDDEDEMICGVSYNVEEPVSKKYKSDDEDSMAENMASKLGKGTLIQDTIRLDSFGSDGTNTYAEKMVTSSSAFNGSSNDHAVKKNGSSSVDTESSFYNSGGLLHDEDKRNRLN